MRCKAAVLIVLLSATLVGCRSAVAPQFPRPASISGCETYSVQICWTWVRNGDMYVHTGADGSTANLEIIRFTETELVVERVDYGKHTNFTAIYSGVVNGRSVRNGAVTWNHAGNVRSGHWSAEW